MNTRQTAHHFFFPFPIHLSSLRDLFRFTSKTSTESYGDQEEKNPGLGPIDFFKDGDEMEEYLVSFRD